MVTATALKTSLDFYPRSPCGERHQVAGSGRSAQDFYPRSPCGERRHMVPGFTVNPAISIHALLAESDISVRDN